MVPDQQRLSPTERDNLVAYLDGELNAAESRAIATKLTQSMTARREVEQLQKNWDLLEHLPRPKASEDFTARTLVGVDQIAQKGERLNAAFANGIKNLVAALLVAAGTVLAFGLGHLLVVRVWPNPTDRLARDLEIAENLDAYRAIGRFEFLELLDKSPEFNSLDR